MVIIVDSVNVDQIVDPVVVTRSLSSTILIDNLVVVDQVLVDQVLVVVDSITVVDCSHC